MYMLVLLITLLSGLNPVSMKVTPTTAMAPASVRVLLRVERHPDNRSVCLGYVPTAEGLERQTCWDLMGERAPLLTQVTFTDIPGGEYEMHAEVCRGHWDSGANTCSQGWIRSMPQRFTVIGRQTQQQKGRK